MAAEHMVDVEVLTPEGEVWEGEVRQVSTRTETGEIGILANHAPLLAALRPVNCSATKNGCERKRSILRALETVWRSSSESSSMPRMAMMSCSSL